MNQPLIRVAVLIGAIGVLINTIGMVAGAREANFAWLTAFAFWLSLALGALLFIMIQHAMSGTWFILFRRIAEAITLPLVVLALLFLPVVLGLRVLYPWADHNSAVELAGGRETWFDLSFFLVRAVVYFALWLTTAVLLSRWSLRQQDGDALELARKQRVFSAALLPLVCFSGSFAAFDWLMSLEPAWYSTIFGIYFLAGTIVAFLALLAVVTHLLAQRGHMPGLSASHTHALGKLLLVFIVFWAYIAYSQYFLIWIADVPEEAHWYYIRSRGSWGMISVLLIVGHFAIPFTALLSRRLKRSSRGLAAVGAWLLAMHYLDLYWLVQPAATPERVQPTLYDVAAFAGIGGLFVACAGWWLNGRLLVPAGDPRMQQSLGFFTS